MKNVHVQIQTKHKFDARHGEQQTAIQSTNQTLSVASPTTLIGILPWAPHSPTLRRPTGCSWNCVVPRRGGVVCRNVTEYTCQARSAPVLRLLCPSPVAADSAESAEYGVMPRPGRRRTPVR